MSRRFIPRPTPSGASPIGVHYLSDWWKCRMKWYWAHLHPTPGGQGIVPAKPNENLMLGLLCHRGREVYYTHQLSTGAADVDPAVEAIRLYSAELAEQFTSDAERELLTDQAIGIVRRYHDFFGPYGKQPEKGTFEIERDADGVPIIERQYTVDLGYSDIEGKPYYVTCRVDGIARYHGFLCIDEYKTAKYPDSYIRSLRYGAQIAMQNLVLDRLFGDTDKLTGVVVTASAKSKPGAGWKSQACARDLIRCHPEELDQFALDCARTLREIDDHVAAWRIRCADGLEPARAALEVFGLGGKFNGKCIDFGRTCEYEGLDYALPVLERALAGYRPKTRIEDADHSIED